MYSAVASFTSAEESDRRACGQRPARSFSIALDALCSSVTGELRLARARVLPARGELTIACHMAVPRTQTLVQLTDELVALLDHAQRASVGHART